MPVIEKGRTLGLIFFVSSLPEFHIESILLFSPGSPRADSEIYLLSRDLTFLFPQPKWLTWAIVTRPVLQMKQQKRLNIWSKRWTRRWTRCLHQNQMTQQSLYPHLMFRTPILKLNLWLLLKRQVTENKRTVEEVKSKKSPLRTRLSKWGEPILKNYLLQTYDYIQILDILVFKFEI